MFPRWPRWNEQGRFVVFCAEVFFLRGCAMQHTEEKRNVVPQLARAKNEFLFTVFMVLVVIAVVLGFTVPKRVSAEPLDRLRWKAPPALVADVLIGDAIDGRVADDRCLNARLDAPVLVRVDRKDHVHGMGSLVVSTADALRPYGRTPD
jgi:hypothetical protein